ncbi:recombinase RecT [Sphingobacterium sp. JUb56]|uniref:recombinase RecT n=1 Tax=Sphingobacterium sp. JUb56 TaxID=2587145 RepID=UPI001619966B|nr:RecT family recombinase [Sphingobacterium sp. JUb56]MBB2951998.1 recombination protein RecT [Sphingobacterium sp. JUb56]
MSNQQSAVAAQQEEKNITTSVLAKITSFQQSGELRIPKDYSPENALKSAWLILQETVDSNKQPVLATCSKESIANALLKMVVWGLSPLKKQGDFIAYGTKLEFTPEYTGNLVLAKRYGGLVNHNQRAIFKGDEFEFETDLEFPYRTRILKHKQSLENIGGEVIGAYFAFELADGTKDVEIMNISQIKLAWGQGGSKGNSGAHKNFSDQMAIKTVINRGCKLLIRSSDDSVLYEKEDQEYDAITDQVRTDIRANANKQTISFEDAVIVEEIKSRDAIKEKKPASIPDEPKRSAMQPNENPGGDDQVEMNF